MSLKIGRYEVKKEIGRGAMGVVYLAFDPLINRTIAVKVLKTDIFNRKDVKEFEARFYREAQTAGALSHPNIVTVYDLGKDEDKDCLYIVMEYIDGMDLYEILYSKKSLDLNKKISILSQIADGIDYAHSNKIIHRDLKPGNILITPDYKAKITDFGIAKISGSNFTHTGKIMGTPSYMSPEQFKGKNITNRSDLFSFGALAYEILIEERAFQGEDITTIMYKIINENPVIPSFHTYYNNHAFNKVIYKILDKDPSSRYSSASEFIDSLKASISQNNTDSEEILIEPELTEINPNKVKTKKIIVNDDKSHIKLSEDHSSNGETVGIDSSEDIPEKPVDKVSQKASASDHSEKIKEPLEVISPDQISKKKPAIFILLLVFLLLLGIYFILSDHKPVSEIKYSEAPSGDISPDITDSEEDTTEDIEEEAWQKARQEDTILSYKEYIARYSEGKYINAANSRISEIREEQEDNAWQKARQENTIIAYEEYKSNYPEGRYENLADNRISEIRAEIHRVDVQHEDRAWEKAKETNTIASYEDYKSNYPEGRYASLAGNRISKLREQQAEAERLKQEDEAWSQAQNEDSLSSYQSYLTSYPNGRYASQARSNIEKLKQPPYLGAYEEIETNDEYIEFLEVSDLNSTPPVKISGREPHYPRNARRTGVQGRVIASITIGVDGRVKDIEIIRGIRGEFEEDFNEAVKKALNTYRYRAATLDGKPVETKTQIILEFRP